MLIVKFDKKRFAFRLLSSGVIAILLYPSVNAAIHADETFGFIGIQGTGPWAPLYDAFTYPFTQGQLNYFLTEQGRIVPFSSSIYQTGFWISTHFAVLFGTSIITAYSILKSVLLVGVFVSIRSWIKLLARNSQFESPGSWATDVTLLMALVFAIGVRVDAPSINSFITYPALTYPPLIFAFILPSLVTYFLAQQSQFGNAMAIGTAITLSVVLTFGYELNFVAVGVIFLTLCVLNRDRYPKARVTAVASASAFVVSFIANRLIITKACATANCYVGTQLAIDGNLPATMVSNLIGSIPLKHVTSYVIEARGISELSMEPGLRSVTWWIVAITVALVGVQLLRLVLSQPQLLFSKVLAQMALISLALAGASILLTSVSVVAQARLLQDATPFRGYIVTWAALSIAIVAGLVYSVYRLSNEGFRIAGLVFVAGLLGFLTLYLRPYSNVANDLDLKLYSQGKFAAVLDELIYPDLTPAGGQSRCEKLVNLGDSRQAEEIRATIEPTFRYFYSMPFCSKD